MFNQRTDEGGGNFCVEPLHILITNIELVTRTGTVSLSATSHLICDGAATPWSFIRRAWASPART